ncbi:hypothetical protein J4401_05485 [Candidatus Woesearchaeota archaeon]|nr:hypothetical protein [Candidatus Woesearchaeota archaeon]
MKAYTTLAAATALAYSALAASAADIGPLKGGIRLGNPKQIDGIAHEFVPELAVRFSGPYKEYSALVSHTDGNGNRIYAAAPSYSSKEEAAVARLPVSLTPFKNGGEAGFTFNIVKGDKYEIQGSTDLINWSIGVPVTANQTGDYIFTTTPKENSLRESFYRVAHTPQPSYQHTIVFSLEKNVGDFYSGELLDVTLFSRNANKALELEGNTFVRYPQKIAGFNFNKATNPDARGALPDGQLLNIPSLFRDTSYKSLLQSDLFSPEVLEFQPDLSIVNGVHSEGDSALVFAIPNPSSFAPDPFRNLPSSSTTFYFNVPQGEELSNLSFVLTAISSGRAGGSGGRSPLEVAVNSQVVSQFAPASHDENTGQNDTFSLDGFVKTGSNEITVRGYDLRSLRADELNVLEPITSPWIINQALYRNAVSVNIPEVRRVTTEAVNR